MAYSLEVIQRARQRLAGLKADRESQYQQRLQEAYRELPRLRQIDQQLRQTMVTAAQAAFSRGGDVAAMIEDAKQKNLSLQAERKALIDATFAPGWLNETPVCDHCGGNGYIGSTMCTCLTELCREEQRKALTVLNAGEDDFNAFRLDVYPDKNDPRLGINIRAIMERTYQICRGYAENFGAKSGNLLFSGDTGLGKTFLSACIARTVSDKGYSVVYESAGHLFAHLERAKFSGDEDARQNAERYTACDLLIIDDLGTEMPGQFTTAALYTLINDRILSGKATIVSTNLTVEELTKRYNSQIASRLRSFQRLAFVGEDIRLKKKGR